MSAAAVIMKTRSSRNLARRLFISLATVMFGVVYPLPTSPVTSMVALAIQQLSQNKKFLTVVSAYSSSPDETSGDPWITASGETVRDGIVACPREFPFGTRLLIEGQVYECLDRLAPQYDSRVDIWMPSKDVAMGFGLREIWVEILPTSMADSRSLVRWSGSLKQTVAATSD